MRMAAVLAYEGGHYVGWQLQRDGSSIQGMVEGAVSRLAMQPVRIMSAGRTDRGVHARYQVIHFDTNCERSLRTWKAGVNYYLPHDIRLLWIDSVSNSFHARFSAEERNYRYLIYQGGLPWFREYSWMLSQPLRLKAMQIAAQNLVGEHDFSSFRAAACQAHSPVRKITRLELKQQSDWIQINISANSFLHHMVRNIVGVLVEVGQAKRTSGSIVDLLVARNRRYAAMTAPAQGLYLHFIRYPVAFDLPAERPEAVSLL